VPPHIHALYGEYEALIIIETKEVLAGYLPKTYLAKAKRIVKQEEENLLEMFYLLNPKTKKR